MFVHLAFCQDRRTAVVPFSTERWFADPTFSKERQSWEYPKQDQRPIALHTFWKIVADKSTRTESFFVFFVFFFLKWLLVISVSHAEKVFLCLEERTRHLKLRFLRAYENKVNTRANKFSFVTGSSCRFRHHEVGKLFRVHTYKLQFKRFDAHIDISLKLRRLRSWVGLLQQRCR